MAVNFVGIDNENFYEKQAYLLKCLQATFSMAPLLLYPAESFRLVLQS